MTNCNCKFCKVTKKSGVRLIRLDVAASQVAADAAVAVARVDGGRGGQEAARGEQQEGARVVGAIVVVVVVVGGRGGGQGVRHFDRRRGLESGYEL